MHPSGLDLNLREYADGAQVDQEKKSSGRFWATI